MTRTVAVVTFTATFDTPGELGQYRRRSDGLTGKAYVMPTGGAAISGRGMGDARR